MSDAISKYRDRKLAEQVITAYADDDGFTAKECAGLGIEREKCDALVRALGDGSEGIVTDAERKDLIGAGFSKTFVAALAGKDGKRALRNRVKWFAWRAEANFFEKLFDGVRRECHNYESEVLGTNIPLGDAIEFLTRREERIDALKYLQKVEPDGVAAIPALIRAVGSDDSTVEMYGSGALEAMGETAKVAAPALMAAVLRSEVPNLSAARALGSVARSDRALFHELRRMYRQGDSKIRCSAASALGGMGPAAKDAVTLLISALNDENRYVRSEAAWALGKVDPKNKAAVEALTKALDDMHAKKDAAMSLLQAGDAADVSVVDKAIGILGPVIGFDWMRDDLRKIAHIVTPLLIKRLVAGGEKTRGYAAEAITGIGAPAVPALVNALDDKDARLRKSAAETLGRIGKPAHHALPFLERMAEEDIDPACRKAAGEAVEKILKGVK